MPDSPPSQPVAYATVELIGRHTALQSRQFEVDARIGERLADFRSYQLHVEVSGGRTGHLRLIDILIRPTPDWAFAGLPTFEAFNVTTQQMLAGLEVGTTTTRAGDYLATFVFEASDDAAGDFVVDLKVQDPTDQTFLIAGVHDEVRVTATHPAVIRVAAPPADRPAPSSRRTGRVRAE